MTLDSTQTTNLGSTDLLRWAVYGDAVFCFVSGAASLALGHPLAELLGIANTGLLIVVDAGLLAYGAGLALLARRDLALAARVAIVGNTVWIAGTLLGVFTGWLGFPPAANVVTLLCTVVVGAILVAQVIGLRRTTSRT